MVTLNELSQHRLIINLSSVILPLLTRTRPMWDEIQDMPGEIFDLDIDDRELMPPDMQEDIEKEDPLTDD